MERVETGGIPRTTRSRHAATRRRAIAFAPLLGLVVFLAYLVPNVWLQMKHGIPLATPSAGCALLVGHMAWPLCLALGTFGRRFGSSCELHLLASRCLGARECAEETEEAAQERHEEPTRVSLVFEGPRMDVHGQAGQRIDVLG